MGLLIFGSGLFVSISVLTTTYFIQYLVESLYCACSNVEFTLSQTKLELCADELVVGGGVGWSYDRLRRRAAHFSSAAAA